MEPTLIPILSLDDSPTIDPATDYLAIANTGLNTTFKINRNNLLEITSAPVGISDTQTISNKILDNSNLVTLLDGSFTLQNNVDTTKRAVFTASAITTGTTRTYTLPNISSTLATLGGTQTFTGANSFAGSAWSGGTIDNATITVDSIAGHTTAGSGTIYGLSIAAGAITTSGYAGPTALQTNAVQAAQLATNAITLGMSTPLTTTITTTSTTSVQATGLTVTVTIPAGGRRIKVTMSGGTVSNGSSPKNTVWQLWRGTVGSGTVIAGTEFTFGTSNYSTPTTLIGTDAPSAGSVTYNVGYLTDASGTAAIIGSSTSPVILLVEAI